MSENTNNQNINNSQPNGANSVNNAPQRPQSFGANQSFPPRQQGIPPRQSSGIPPRQYGSFPPRQQGVPPRQSGTIPPRQQGVPPRPSENQGQASGGSQSRPNLYSINRPSSSEKFERGSRTLSHISGGSSGAKLYRIDRPSQDDSRRKVGGIVLDTDIIQDANQQKLADTTNKRKTVTIVILSMLLALSLVYLVVAVAGYTRRGVEPNCRYHLSSEVDAYWLVENNTQTEFSVREGLANDRIYEIESLLVVNSDDKINIKISITATMDGNEIFIAGLYESADNMVRVEGKNAWVYVGGHQGAGQVHLFKGIDFFGSPAGLNSKNVDINIYAEITKV